MQYRSCAAAIGSLLIRGDRCSRGGCRAVVGGDAREGIRGVIDDRTIDDRKQRRGRRLSLRGEEGKVKPRSASGARPARWTSAQRRHAPSRRAAGASRPRRDDLRVSAAPKQACRRLAARLLQGPRRASAGRQGALPHRPPDTRTLPLPLSGADECTATVGAQLTRLRAAAHQGRGHLGLAATAAGPRWTSSSRRSAPSSSAAWACARGRGARRSPTRPAPRSATRCCAAARAAGGDAVLTILPPNPARGTEPPPPVAAAFAAADVFIAPCHAVAVAHERAQARERGAARAARRCPASPPTCSRALMSADFDALSARCQRGRASCSTRPTRRTSPARAAPTCASTCAAAAASPTTATSPRAARSATCPAARASSRPAGGEGTIAASSLAPPALADEPVLLTVRDGRLAERRRRRAARRLPRAARRPRRARAQPRRARRRHERPRDADRQHARGREDPRHRARRVRRERRDRRHGDGPGPPRRRRARAERCGSARRRCSTPGAGCSAEPERMLLAVPNVSEGRDAAAIAAIGAAFASHGRAAARRPRRPRPPPLGLHARRRGRASSRRRSSRARAARRARSTCATTAAATRTSARSTSRPSSTSTRARRGAACAEALVAGDELGARRRCRSSSTASSPAGARAPSCAAAGPAALAAAHREPASCARLRPARRIDPRAGAVLVAARPPLVAFNVELAPPATLERRARDRRARSARAARGPAGRARARPRAARARAASRRSRRTSRTTARDAAGRASSRRSRGTPRSPAAELVGLAPAAAFDGFPERRPIPVRNRRTCRGRARAELSSVAPWPRRRRSAADQAPRQRRRHGRGARAHGAQADGRRAQAPQGRAAQARRGPLRPAADVAQRRSTARSSRRSCSSACCSSASSSSRSRRRSRSTVFMFALLHPAGLLHRPVRLPRRQAKKLAGGASAQAGRGVMDVRMFTVGPVQENCFLVRPRRRRPRGDRRPGRGGAAPARGDRGAGRHARRDPAHAHALRPRRRGRAGRAGDRRAVYCPRDRGARCCRTSWPSCRGPASARSSATSRADGQRRRDARARRADIDVHLHARPQPRPRHLRDPRRGTRCSPATCCSRARSAAPTCPAATGRRCCARSPALLDALPRRDASSIPGHMGITTLGAERATNPFLAELVAPREREAPGAARHVRRAARGRGRARARSRRPRARVLERRRLPAHRDADLRGHRAVRARRRRVDRHRPEGDVHLRRRRRALADAAPGGHRAGLPRLRRARHAQAAPAGEALVPVELLPPREAAGRALPPVLAGRRRGDRLRRPRRRRRVDRAARRRCSTSSASASVRLRLGSLGTPATRAAYREELQALPARARRPALATRSARASTSTRCARSTPTTRARAR